MEISFHFLKFQLLQDDEFLFFVVRLVEGKIWKWKSFIFGKLKEIKLKFISIFGIKSYYF